MKWMGFDFFFYQHCNELDYSVLILSLKYVMITLICHFFYQYKQKFNDM